MENNKENTTENTNKSVTDKKKDSKNSLKIFNSRSLKYGSASLITIVAVIAIAVIVNTIFSTTVLSKLIGKEAIKLDLTPNKLYSLGDQTDKIVGGLNKEVKIYALYDEAKISTDTQLKEVNELLKKYTKYKNIKLEYVDTDKNPTFIKSIDPEGIKNIQKEDIVFVSGKKVKNLNKYDLFTTQFDQSTMQQYTTGNSAEQAFTGAIKFVSSDATPVVYFLEGHDEKKPTSDYSTVSEYLVRNNYDVKTLNLITSEKVPDDAEIVIVAAPKKDISSAEKDKLMDFFKNGGKAVFAVDPIDNSPELSQFQDLLSYFNVSINNDKVKENDDQRFIKGKPYDILPDVVDNSINTALNPSSLYVIMPSSRSIATLKNTKDYITVTSLMKSSAKAVGEPTDGKSKTNQGPLDIAVAVQNDGAAKSSKIVLVGNGSFMTDTSIKQYSQYSVNGLYFFLNSLNWLQDKKDDVIIAPKTYDTPQLQMSSSAANVMALITVIVLPLLILGLGTFVWLRRRHL
jgi:ABC-type uncharacterized transport system.